jgi:hypothetical protein
MEGQNQPAAKPEAGHEFDFTTGEGDKKVTKTYKTKLAIMIIPGINDSKPLTSLEVSTDEEAQAYLVANAVGSAIEEVAK